MTRSSARRRFRHAAPASARAFLALALTAALSIGSASVVAAAQVPAVRVDLRVLVVTDGLPEAEAARQSLIQYGVPVETIDLRDPQRRRIDAAFLADTTGAAPLAKFQGVVLPDEYPAGLAHEEMAHLYDYERQYGIRQLSATVPATPTVGLTEPGETGYSGSFDGQNAFLTGSAAGDFGYARGRVPFADESPDGVDTWIEIGQPLPGFEPFITATSPDGRTSGAVAGVFAREGREEMVLTFSYNATSIQFQTLAPGLVNWLTKGVHLGFERNYFSIHIDDVLLPNARWVPDADCAAGVDCPTTVPPQPLIRMTPEDVDFASKWQRDHGLRMDLVYNGSGSGLGGPGAEDPLTAALVAKKDDFGWINHTWTHLYLGCIRDNGKRPWECATLPIMGWTRYVSQGRIEQEVELNVEWAERHGIPVNPTELVTGEHGGLKALPQMPGDNPNLAPAMTAAGVLTLASDASEERDYRKIGSATTVPRHPINIDYCAATELETVDSYNWKYTSKADGGSGECEVDGGCIRPADPANGFDSFVVPVEAQLALSHVLANDPRPHYVHQSQLTEDRTIFPVLEHLLREYRDLFHESRPLLVPTMSEARDVLIQQSTWAAAVAEGRVQARLEGNVVTVTTIGPVDVPLTTRAGTRLGRASGPEFGEAYSNARSGWLRIKGEQQFVIDGGESA